MKLVLLLVVLFVALGLVEHVRHRRSLGRIPIRIHVNGTRGKSSVTRLIAAGLRAGSVRTVAKTTGSAARFVHADGTEEPVRRSGPPNIKEQIAIMRQAAGEGARALVIECMAVRPDLQQVSEDKVVHSTIGVVTNVRPDHLEVMGPTLGNVALALAGTVPRGGQFFTAEHEFTGLFRETAARRGSAFHLSDPGAVSDEDLQGFSYIEHPENIGLALDVCEAVGVSREVALSGMRSVTPDAGALRRIPLRQGGKEIDLVTAFAANDPASTLVIWDRLGLGEREPDAVVLLVNLRGDRMRRSKDLAEIFHRRIRAGAYVLIGDQTKLFRRLVIGRGVPAGAVVDMGGAPAEEIYRVLLEVAPSGSTVLGVGNIGGAGAAFLDYVVARRGDA